MHAMTYFYVLFISIVALGALWHFYSRRKKSCRSEVNKAAASSTAVVNQSNVGNTAVYEQISSLEHFDQLLNDEFVKFVAMFPEKPISFIQRHFSACDILPKLGWSLIEYGELAALARNEPELLMGALWRFKRCAHAYWGHADERGVHAGGYDFCTLVVPTIYFCLLGKSYISEAFPSSRKMSNASYPAYMHAANIMLCIEHKQWPHAEKSKEKVRAFMGAKSSNKVDRSFVGYFFNILNGDVDAAALLLIDFYKGYDRSGWGKYKPGTRSTFIQALTVYAGYYVDNTAIKHALKDLFSDQQLELWEKFHALRDGFDETRQGFPPPLDFLNDMSFHLFPTDER